MGNRMIMIAQFNNQRISKAVGIIVQDEGVLGFPKGLWHGWLSELFIFFKKPIALLILMLTCYCLTGQDISFKIKYCCNNSINSLNKFDIQHDQHQLKIIVPYTQNEFFQFDRIQVVNILSRQGDLLPSISSFSLSDLIIEGDKSPCSVMYLNTTDSGKLNFQKISKQNEFDSLKELYFDESQRSKLIAIHSKLKPESI